MRPQGLLVLAALVVVGVGVTAGYLKWKAPEVGRIVGGRRAEIAAAPRTPEGRLAKWLEFGGPQIHHRLELLRFSAAQPWLVTHAVGEDPRALAIHGIDLSGMPRGVASVEGLAVRVRLPRPRLLGRGGLAGDNAASVLVVPGDAQVPDEVAKAREIVRFVLRELASALETDIPGASLEILIGPQEDWGETGSPR